MSNNNEKFLVVHKKVNNFVTVMNHWFDIALKYAMIATVLVMVFGIAIYQLAMRGIIS